MTDGDIEREPQLEEVPFPERVQWCLDNLGQRITTVGSGLSDTRPVKAWARGGPVALEHQQRIDLLYAAAKAVSETYDAQTARAFVRSANPYLGDVSVLETIADTEDLAKTQALVRGAVDSFLDKVY